MRIIKKKVYKEKSSRILLIRKDQDLVGYIPEEKQRTYVQKRLGGGKDTALLNQLDHLVIVRSLNTADSPKNNRLESARKAGFELHSLLIDHDIESVALVNGGVEPEESVAFAEGLALTNYQFLKYLNL